MEQPKGHGDGGWLMRWVLAVATLPLGAFAGGLFGALHNQVSYRVSPDYFHGFKFQQFAVSPYFLNPAGASLVGIGASWWMGLLLGIPIAVVALGEPTRGAQLRATLRGVALAIVVTACASLVGLALGFVFPTAADVSHYPGPIHDPVAFASAGSMHNASYLGGALAFVVVPLALWYRRKRMPR